MCKVPIERRLRQGPRRADGTPGNYYLRIRLRPQQGWLKSKTLDLPLETNCPDQAVERAGYAVRCLLRAGAAVIGDLSDLQSLVLPPRGKGGRG